MTHHIEDRQMQGQRSELEWRDGDVPVSTRFDDPYFSLENGLEETCHVFLRGNDLPARLCDGFHIAELGFGTGLNFLATLQAWRAANRPGKILFTSFEAFPIPVEAILRAVRAFSALPVEVFAKLADKVLLPELIEADDFVLRVIPGDARDRLADWAGCADAWYLDGFSPAKNPELWEPSLLAQVACHTRPGGTVATYTAAGFVRRGLAEAGFEVSRVPGYGRKRHMTIARMPETGSPG
jgi:tRNA U34 5-methylaminomethyl-2-thiouridine-forming methyltransferase MnmC